MAVSDRNDLNEALKTDAESPAQVFHNFDLDFTVKAKPSSHCVEFEIFQMVGQERGESGEFDVPVYDFDKGGTTADLAKAIKFANGHVRCDGCSNWSFSQFHACCQEQLLNVGKVLAYCWELTETLCPSWNP